MPQKYLIPPGEAHIFNEQFKAAYWEAVKNNPNLSYIKDGWIQFSRMLATVALRQHSQYMKCQMDDK